MFLLTMLQMLTHNLDSLTKTCLKFSCRNTLKSPLICLFVCLFFFVFLSALDSCNSCSTKCSSSKWLWGQQLLRGERRGNIPPANQEVRGRGARHSPFLNHDRLEITLYTPFPQLHKDMNDPYCALLSASLWRLQTKKDFSFFLFAVSVCLFLADKFVCNGCQVLENQNCVHH